MSGSAEWNLPAARCMPTAHSDDNRAIRVYYFCYFYKRIAGR